MGSVGRVLTTFWMRCNPSRRASLVTAIFMCVRR
jgi:hypothetical protein